MSNDYDQMMNGDAIYDSMTGELAPEVQEKLENEVTQKAIEDGEQVESLMKHPGWIMLKKLIQDTIATESELLLYAKDLSLIIPVQATIRARRDLLSWMEMKLIERKVLLEAKQ